MKTTALVVASLLVVGCSAPTELLPPINTLPAAPTRLSLEPGSPSSARAVVVRGFADDGTTVEFFADAACASRIVASAPATQLTFAGIMLTPTPNATTYFSARATKNGVSSLCSAPVIYVHDDVAPTTPTTSRYTVVTPGSSPRVRLEGSAESGTTVRVFTTTDCSGAPKAEGASNDGAFGLELDIEPDVVVTLAAVSVDAAGNRSGCSSPPITFTYDALAPTAPVLTTVSPASPSRNPMPSIGGRAEANATIRFFRDASCSVSLQTMTTANANGEFQTFLTVPRNTTTLVRATATDASGNVSPCSNALPFRHDDAPPVIPYFGQTSPTSPSSTATAFTVSVTFEVESTVEVFSQANCAGPVSLMQYSANGAVSFPVTVARNTGTEFSARATDTAGNVSGCSQTKLVAHDDVAPMAPTLTGTVPTSPSNQTTYPSVTGTAEPLTTVRVYRSATCTGTATSTQTGLSGAIAVSISASSNTTTTFSAQAVDLAGNLSPCSNSITYRYDNTIPARPTFFGTLPPSPSKSTSSAQVVGQAEAGATVRLFTNSACSGVAAGTGTSAMQGQFSVSVAPVLGGALTLWANAVDAAGNSSACSVVSQTYTQVSSGAGWSDDRPFGFSSGLDFTPSVVVTASGEPVAVWNRQEGAPSPVFTSSFVNGAWTTPVSLGSSVDPFLGSFSLVTDASGTVAAAWTQSGTSANTRAPWVARRSPAGTWSTAERLDTRGNAGMPDIALDGSGNAIVAWESFVSPSPSSYQVFARLAPAGGAWGAEANVGMSNNSFSPKVALSTSGKASVLYVNNAGSGLSPSDQLYSNAFDPATGWSGAVLRSSAHVVRYALGSGFGSSGAEVNAWLYRTSNTATPVPMSSRRASSASVWSTPVSPVFGTTSQQELQVAVGAGGETVMAWPTATGIVVARSVNGGAWSTSPFPRGYRLRLAMTTSGAAVLAWMDGNGLGTPQRAFVTTWQGTSWSSPQLLDVDLVYGDGVEVGVNASGRVAAVWTKRDATGTRSELHSRVLE